MSSSSAAAVHRPWPGLIEAYRDRLPVGDNWKTVTLLEGGTPLITEPQAKRRSALESLLKRRRVPGVKLVPQDTDGERVLRRARREQFAGVIARRTDAAYAPGRKADAMLRIPAK